MEKSEEKEKGPGKVVGDPKAEEVAKKSEEKPKKGSNNASLQNSSEKKKTSDEFKIKLSLFDIQKHKKSASKEKAPAPEEPKKRISEAPASKKLNSKIQELPEAREDPPGKYPKNQLTTRRGCKMADNGKKVSVCQVSYTNPTDPQAIEDLNQRIVSKGMSKDMIKMMSIFKKGGAGNKFDSDQFAQAPPEKVQVERTPRSKKAPRKDSQFVGHEELSGNPDKFLEEMIRRPNTGLSKRNLGAAIKENGSGENPQNEEKNAGGPEVGENKLKSPKTRRRALSRSKANAKNQRTWRGRPSLNKNQIPVIKVEKRGPGRPKGSYKVNPTGDVMGHSVVQNYLKRDSEPGDVEYQMRMRDDLKFREELKGKVTQKLEFKRDVGFLEPANEAFPVNAQFSPHGPAEVVDPRLGKRHRIDSSDNEDPMNLYPQMMGGNPKKVKVRSNPPETVKPQFREDQRVPRQEYAGPIDMHINKDLSIKSERPKVKNQGQARQPNPENLNLSQRLSEFEENKNNPLDRQGPEMDLDINVDVHMNGDPGNLARQTGFEKGFIKEMGIIQQRSALSSGGSESVNEPDQVDERLQTYLNYKQNMSGFLGFEPAIERSFGSGVEPRLKFLKERRGVDQNYWLNYYCSLTRKQEYLDYQDIMKGRLNCISYSLKEYNNNYNHKIHRGIFNMGKGMYRAIKREISEFENGQLKMYNSMQTPPGYYRNYVGPGHFREMGPQMGYVKRPEYPPQAYMHPSMYYNAPSGQYQAPREKYFPYYYNNQPRGRPQEMEFREQAGVPGPEMAPNERYPGFERYKMQPHPQENNFLNEEKPWEGLEEDEEQASQMKVVKVKNKSGREMSEEEPTPVVPKPRKVRKESSKLEEKNQSKSKKKSKNKRKKKKSDSFSLEEDPEPEEEEFEAVPEAPTQRRNTRAKEEPEKKPAKPKPKPSDSRQILNKSTADGPLQEPERDDSREWTEYFAQINYANIKKGTRSYEKLSSNFAFELEEVLKFQDQYSEQIFQREVEKNTADMSKLNCPKSFKQYYNPKEKKEDFRREIQQDCEGFDSEYVRKLGKFRKHVKENLGIVTSIRDIANFLEKNKDEKLVWGLIEDKANSVKTFIKRLKMKRFN